MTGDIGMATLPTKEVINTQDPREVIFFIVAGSCGLVLLALVAWIVVGLVTSDSKRSLSGPLTLSSNWIEISPDKPIRPAKQYQDIVLYVDPVDSLVKDNLHWERIQTTGGAQLKPEVQLFDQTGNMFTASVVNSESNENSLVAQIPELPTDRTYNTLRLRSDKPIRLSRVVWHCWNGK